MPGDDGRNQIASFFDCEDGSSNSLLPSTSTVTRGHVASGMAAVDDLSIYCELGADMLSEA